MENRKYIAISIKHSIWRPNLQYWGWNRTKDDEKRCYAGYVEDINKCELYSFEEFNKKYDWMGVKVVEDETLFPVLKRKFRNEDTILVDYEKFKDWLGE